MLLGAQCWVFDSVHLRKRDAFFAGRAGPRAQVLASDIVIPDWAPPSLMGLGIVLVIYSHTIPRWIQNGG